MRYISKGEMKILDVRNRNKLIKCKKKKNKKRKRECVKSVTNVIKILIRNSISEESKS